MDITRLGPVLGAEIGGVDLAKLDDEAYRAIRNALVEHQVLVFKSQHLTMEDQVGFGQRFGDLLVHHFVPRAVADQPEVLRLEADAQQPDRVANVWHSDETYRAAPPMASILRSVSVPELGGGTVFASMTAAYDGLSSRMKDHIAGLTAVHGFGRFRQMFFSDPSRLPLFHQIELENPNPAHPVVCLHPESGREVLFVNWHFTSHIVELPEEEGRMVLDYLRNRVLQPEYQFRVQWEPDMVVMWDNRSVQHYATKDYYPQHRRMERVTIAGEPPIAAEGGRPVEVQRIVVEPSPALSVGH